MLNDKVLKSVADDVTKVMAEALKGDQHKIDKNKNNKIDAHDFKLLRKEETVTEEEKKKPNPFAWKNTPRETREKGELTGHESKRTSTGTVYTKKAVKEEASQEEFNKEIEKAKAKASGKVAQPEIAKPAVQAVQQEEVQLEEKRGLWDNIHAKRERIAKGSGEKMRSPGDKGAPTEKALKQAQESVEQIDERHLTSGEKAEVEKNVKGMKKNLQGFKARYGDRAKEVMYATATKQAKGE